LSCRYSIAPPPSATYNVTRFAISARRTCSSACSAENRLINVPIFNFGRTRGNLDVAHARENIAIANYERAIQTGFQEVSDALAGRRYLAEQVAAQERNTIAQTAHRRDRAHAISGRGRRL
jgi:outer membrane protein TolC